MCLNCARRGGRQPGCPMCASIAPPPRYQIVQDIIGRVAQEHRLAQLAADEQFRADFKALRDKHEERLAQKALCRRKRMKERMALSREAKKALSGESA